MAHYKLTLLKQYLGYQRDQFPARQKPPVEIRKAYLQDSPGIQTSAPAVKALAKQLTDGVDHPWDMAQAFVGWIAKNIRPQIGSYTSVMAALENRKGDCEEMAAVFVALCRSQGIPARLVWVPNHNWAEFYLTDEQGQGRWIPAHTAGYSWFGWTGAHELVLQKGDRALVPDQHKRVRLLEDWSQWMGARPRSRFSGEIEPLPPTAGGDAGPGPSREGPARRMAGRRRPSARSLHAALSVPAHSGKFPRGLAPSVAGLTIPRGFAAGCLSPFSFPRRGMRPDQRALAPNCEEARGKGDSPTGGNRAGHDRAGSLRQIAAEKLQPVAVKDGVDVGGRVASLGQQRLQAAQIGDRFQIARRLLGSEAAVQVAADADVPGVAGQLANVVDLVDQGRHRQPLGRRAADLPAGLEHPGVADHADHGPRSISR